MNSVLEGRGVAYSAEAAGTHGTIRCHVVRRAPLHDRRARYSIVVYNETDAAAQAVAHVPDAPDGRRRTVVQGSIEPQSDFSTTLSLELTAAGLMPEMRVVLCSGETQFTLEVPAVRSEIERPVSDAAPALDFTPPMAIARPVTGSSVAPRAASAPIAPTAAPPAVWRQASSSPAFAPIALGIVAAAAAAWFAIARPELADVSAPAVAAPGAAVSVGYRAAGLGQADFAVIAPDGTLLDSGPLALGSGHVTFAIPRPAAAAYRVRLSIANPLATVTAERYVRVSPPPRPARHVAAALPRRAAAPNPPRIRSLAVDRATLASGESFAVYYDADAASGSIALLDSAAQIAYGTAGLSATGRSTFVAPHVDRPRDFTVVATVRRGDQTAESRIGVTVTPPAANTADASAAAGDAPATVPAVADGSGAAADVPNAAGPLTIAGPATVRAGRPIRVELLGSSNGFHLAMLDGGGRELDAREIPAGTHGASFVAPPVSAATRVVFEATYPQGVGSETILRTVTVTP